MRKKASKAMIRELEAELERVQHQVDEERRDRIAMQSYMHEICGALTGRVPAQEIGITFEGWTAHASRLIRSLPTLEPTKKLSPNAPEPAPKPSTGPAIWDLVIADMRERDETGAKKYGTRLRAGDGRKSLVDAYQEGLDLVVYLRKEIEERGLAC